MRLINFASILPITQLKRALGHASCSVRSSGTTWQVSPIAERRSRQIFSGGDANKPALACTRDSMVNE